MRFDVFSLNVHVFAGERRELTKMTIFRLPHARQPPGVAAPPPAPPLACECHGVPSSLMMGDKRE